MTRIALFTLAVMLATAPAMADEFGSRFGNTSPYALQNTMDTAHEDTQGLGPEDLNDITPAAGDEMPDAEQEELPAATSDDAVAPSDNAANQTDTDAGAVTAQETPANDPDVVEKEDTEDQKPEQDL